MSLSHWFSWIWSCNVSVEGGWNQSSGSSGGQWGVRVSQPWLFDRFHLLLLSENSVTTTWQSCRPAFSTPWLCCRDCTYFGLVAETSFAPSPPLSSLIYLGLVSSLALAQQDIARYNLCSVNELESLSFLNLVMQRFSWGSWNQNSGSSGGQWGVRVSQPWLFDRFHLLLLSDLSF